MPNEKTPRRSFHDSIRTPESRVLIAAGVGAVAAFAAVHAGAEEPRTHRLDHVTPRESISYKEVQEKYWNEVNRHKQRDAQTTKDISAIPQLSADQRGSVIVNVPKAVTSGSIGKLPQKAIGGEDLSSVGRHEG